MKKTKLTEKMNMEFHVDAFDLVQPSELWTAGPCVLTHFHFVRNHHRHAFPHRRFRFITAMQVAMKLKF